MAETAPLDDLDEGLEAINSRFDNLFAAAEKKLHDLQAERARLDQQIREAEQLHTNLRNAKAALRGELPVAAPQERKARAPSGRRAPRGARAAIRKQIPDLLGQFPKGLTAEGINTELKAETKAQKQAIANVLTQMVKEGILTWEGRRKPYKLASAKPE
jgi:uncharacterized phage infection (PIP) family protein YhgE